MARNKSEKKQTAAELFPDVPPLFIERMRLHVFRSVGFFPEKLQIQYEQEYQMIRKVFDKNDLDEAYQAMMYAEYGRTKICLQIRLHFEAMRPETMKQD